MTTNLPTTVQVVVNQQPKLQDAKTLTYGYLQSLKFPPRPFLIHPILQERQVGMIHAATGIGKTWLGLSFAVTAASGNGAGFLGFSREGEGVKVLVLDGEMDAQDLQQRISLIIGAVNADAEAVKRNLLITPRQLQSHDVEFPDIASEEWQKHILNYCKDHQIKLLILDNLSTLAPSMEDENSAAKMNRLNGMLLKAKQNGVSCLSLHHSNKSNESYRGSSIMAVPLDLILALKRPEDYQPVSGETAFITYYEKIRGIIPGEVTRPRTVSLKTTDEGAEWLDDVSPATGGQRLKELLESLEFTKQGDFADYLGVSQPTVSRMVKEAIQSGEFTRAEMNDWFAQAKARKIEVTQTVSDQQTPNPDDDANHKSGVFTLEDKDQDEPDGFDATMF